MRTSKRQKPEMREEYDFSRGVRGKYAGRFAPAANLVVLAPDVAEAFTSSKAVNDALRAQLTKAARGNPRKVKRRKPPRARSRS